MIITKSKIEGGYQLKIADRVYIIFTHVKTGTNGDVTMLNNGGLSGTIYDPKKTEEFNKLWSELK